MRDPHIVLGYGQRLLGRFWVVSTNRWISSFGSSTLYKALLNWKKYYLHVFFRACMEKANREHGEDWVSFLQLLLPAAPGLRGGPKKGID